MKRKKNIEDKLLFELSSELLKENGIGFMALPEDLTFKKIKRSKSDYLQLKISGTFHITTKKGIGQEEYAIICKLINNEIETKRNREDT